MWHLVALLLAFVQLAPYTGSLHIPIPSPEKGTIILCSSWASFTSNLDSVEQASFNASSERPLVVTLVVSNFDSDPYVPLYLGWITHLFAKVDFDPYFMLLEPSVFFAQRHEASLPTSQDNLGSASTRQKVVRANSRLLSVRKLHALKWVFVCLEEGESRFGIGALTQLGTLSKDLNLKLPEIVLHLNHENPWVDGNALLRAYSPYSLILRNYYFEPLATLDFITILPLGPSYYNYVVNRHPFYRGRRYLLASERWRKGSLCYFSGRLNHRSRTGDVARTNLASLYRAIAGSVHDFARNHQRHRLREVVEAGIALSEPKGLGLCSYRSYDGIDSGGYRTEEAGAKMGSKGDRDEQYRSYLQRLASTVFLPAPAGNNPETFRLYEILELGGIPLLVQPFFKRNISKDGTDTKQLLDTSQMKPSLLPQAAYPFRTTSIGLFYHLDKGRCSECREPLLMSCSYPGPVFSSWEEAHCFVSMFHERRKNLYCQSTPLVQRMAAQMVSTESIAAYLDSIQEQLGFWYSMRKCVAQSEIRDKIATLH